ncbi:hypothetical protein GQ43DRAFT_112389 [Delitschia confertaspora ATCC 74209]|uniref:DUF4604 domain-containing protein n=1 Tax=Delitschia confertaspora ATCC 74209 TaxID=1513339 RepID=A0A9P4JHZ8_9PLEO|nr:hypothetical protein GQ43DRAFT_112389 [Delitschia confertaspora ATCC 74209]
MKAKDLSYDSTQPAFLQRLRGQIAGTGDSDRHNQIIPRPKRLQKDEEDDAPTYVLEDTNQSLSKEEYEALIAADNGDENSQAVDVDATKKDHIGAKDLDLKEKESEGDKKKEVGQLARKRKAIKVVTDDQVTDEKDGDKDSKPASKKPKKKAKPIKLSFDD